MTLHNSQDSYHRNAEFPIISEVTSPSQAADADVQVAAFLSLRKKTYNSSSSLSSLRKKTSSSSSSISSQIRLSQSDSGSSSSLSSLLRLPKRNSTPMFMKVMSDDKITSHANCRHPRRMSFELRRKNCLNRLNENGCQNNPFSSVSDRSKR